MSESHQIDPQKRAEAIQNVKQDAKKLADTLKRWCEGAKNPPAPGITNPINELIVAWRK